MGCGGGSPDPLLRRPGDLRVDVYAFLDPQELPFSVTLLGLLMFLILLGWLIHFRVLDCLLAKMGYPCHRIRSIQIKKQRKRKQR